MLNVMTKIFVFGVDESLNLGFTNEILYSKHIHGFISILTYNLEELKWK